MLANGFGIFMRRYRFLTASICLILAMLFIIRISVKMAFKAEEFVQAVKNPYCDLLLESELNVMNFMYN